MVILSRWVMVMNIACCQARTGSWTGAGEPVHSKHGHRGRGSDPAVTGELAVIYGAGMQRTHFGRKRRENSRAQARLVSTPSPALTG